ncbi:MAG: helix-turn-helix transcriptional regulator [Methylococcaceae bacterium]|nr:helix-turn-helix transcriptional regulator [Methylococcaceae bacterium]
MTTEPLNYRSLCPLSTALDLIGDKWSLILVRDMCMGKSKYGDFQNSPEAIPTNILANRLRKLESNGILVKRPYQDKPVRYEYCLTLKGAELLPVIQQLARWAHQHVAESMPPPAWFLNAKPEDLIKASKL